MIGVVYVHISMMKFEKVCNISQLLSPLSITTMSPVFVRTFQASLHSDQFMGRPDLVEKVLNAFLFAKKYGGLLRWRNAIRIRGGLPIGIPGDMRVDFKMSVAPDQQYGSLTYNIAIIWRETFYSIPHLPLFMNAASIVLVNGLVEVLSLGVGNESFPDVGTESNGSMDNPLLAQAIRDHNSREAQAVQRALHDQAVQQALYDQAAQQALQDEGETEEETEWETEGETEGETEEDHQEQDSAAVADPAVQEEVWVLDYQI